MAQYTPKTWVTGETITAAELNALEQAAASALTAADAVATYGSNNPANAGYDLVLILGQSNACGTNDGFDARTDPADGRIFTFDYGDTYARKITGALDPLSHMSGLTGVGPGMPFARWYSAVTPHNRKVLLVPAADGGTPLVKAVAPTWNPDFRGSLYDFALSHVQAALTAAGAGSRLVAVLWVQGENDASDGVTQTVYAQILDRLIGRLRADLALPDLPFLVGGMVPELISSHANAPGIAAAHADTPNRVRCTAYAPGVSGMVQPDGIHFSPAGQRVNGRALAAALPTAKANTSPPAAPTPDTPPPLTDPTPAATVARGTATYGPGKFGNALSGAALAVAGIADQSANGETVEMWLKVATDGTFVAFSNAADQWIGQFNGVAGGSSGGSGGPSLHDGQWHHLARTVTAAGAENYWQDGVNVYSGTGGAHLLNGSNLLIGGFTNATYDWPGQIDELRLSKVVRYTAAFTPPAAPFSIDADTLALYHLDA